MRLPSPVFGGGAPSYGAEGFMSGSAIAADDGSYTIFPSILYLPRRSSISRTQTSGSYFTWRSI